MDAKIRLADQSDLPAILEIYNDVILKTTSIYQDQTKTLEQLSSWFQDKLKSSYPIYVMDVDGEVAGFSSYGAFRSYYGYRYTVENSIHVASKWRGQGIGSKLMMALMAKAREQNYHAMVAAIDSENVLSVRFHEKLGFKKVGELPQVGRKFDRWLTLVLMQVLL